MSIDETKKTESEVESNNNTAKTSDAKDVETILYDGTLVKKPKRVFSKYFLWGLTGFLTVVACILFYFIINNTATIAQLFANINKIMMPVYIAMIIAYLLAPILNFIEQRILYPISRKMKVKDTPKSRKTIRGIGLFITLLLSFAFVFGLLFMMISQIVPSITKLIDNYAFYVDQFQIWVKNALAKNPKLVNFVLEQTGNSNEQIEEYLEKDLWTNISTFLPFIDSEGKIEWSMMQEYIKTILGGVGRAFSILWKSILGLMISVYLLAGKEKFSGRSKKLTYSIFKRHTANEIIKDVRYANKTFIGFFGGKIMDSIIIGILCFIGTTILRTPYAPLVSLFVGITNIIPYFGPFIGAIPSALLIFLVDPMHPWNTIFFVIFILILQQIDGNVIGPKILGDSTGLEGFWVIFAITVFGGFLGIPGMIIGVPLFAVIYAGLRGLAARSLSKKKLSSDSVDYIDVDYIDTEGNVYLFDYDKLEQDRKNNRDNREWLVIRFIKSIITAIKNKKRSGNGKSVSGNSKKNGKKKK